MSAEGKLRELAAKLAERHAERVHELEKKISEIEARKAELQTKLDAARRANDRLSDYPVKVGRGYACPRCAIDRGKHLPLMQQPGAGNSVDKLQCPVCGFEVELSA